MSRVINPDGSGKERSRLSREIVKAIRELMSQPEPNETTRDLAAFITLALFQVYATVDVSVIAWEKRGYWVKADRFRMDWEWSLYYAKDMKEALEKEDWVNIAILSAKIAQKFPTIKIGPKNRIGEPWHGAWKTFKQA